MTITTLDQVKALLGGLSRVKILRNSGKVCEASLDEIVEVGESRPAFRVGFEGDEGWFYYLMLPGDRIEQNEHGFVLHCSAYSRQICIQSL